MRLALPAELRQRPLPRLHRRVRPTVRVPPGLRVGAIDAQFVRVHPEGDLPTWLRHGPTWPCAHCMLTLPPPRHAARLWQSRTSCEKVLCRQKPLDTLSASSVAVESSHTTFGGHCLHSHCCTQAGGSTAASVGTLLTVQLAGVCLGV